MGIVLVSFGCHTGYRTGIICTAVSYWCWLHCHWCANGITHTGVENDIILVPYRYDIYTAIVHIRGVYQYNTDPSYGYDTYTYTDVNMASYWCHTPDAWNTAIILLSYRCHTGARLMSEREYHTKLEFCGTHRPYHS